MAQWLNPNLLPKKVYPIEDDHKAVSESANSLSYNDSDAVHISLKKEDVLGDFEGFKMAGFWTTF